MSMGGVKNHHSLVASLSDTCFLGLWRVDTIQVYLGFSGTFLMAWLIHTLFGFAGDVVMALPFIYVLSFLLPNQSIGDITRQLTIKNKTRHNRKILQPGKVVEFKIYPRSTKL